MIDASKIYQSNRYGDFKIIKEFKRNMVLIRFVSTGYELVTQKTNAVRGFVKDRLSPAVLG